MHILIFGEVDDTRGGPCPSESSAEDSDSLASSERRMRTEPSEAREIDEDRAADVERAYLDAQQYPVDPEEYEIEWAESFVRVGRPHHESIDKHLLDRFEAALPFEPENIQIHAEWE